MNDDLIDLVRWVFYPALLGLVAAALVAAALIVIDTMTARRTPPHGLSFEIEIDPVTGQGRVATINNQTGYAVTNLVLRGTTVRFDLVAP